MKRYHPEFQEYPTCMQDIFDRATEYICRKLDMKWLRLCAHRLFGDYSLYRIYSRELKDCDRSESCPWIMGPILGIQELLESNDSSIRESSQYDGDEAFGFGAWIEGNLVGICWFWAGNRYKKRGFWSLQIDEAKLIEIVIIESFRGRGIAPKLIAFAEHEMKKLGFRCLFARIWHSNTSSLRAFQKAGWKEVAIVLELFPLGRRKPLRFVFKRLSILSHLGI